MLKFFRRIRRKLVDNGQIKKYLLYAFGEILLVVIGILIALQINNWNQDRHEIKLADQYYNSMKDQLNEDRKTLQNELDYNHHYQTQFLYAKNLILSKEKDQIDSLARIALNMVRYADFRRKSSVFQTLVNSGEIKLIRNSQIIEQLQGLEEIYSYINRMEELHEKVILSHIVPDLKETLSIEPVKVMIQEKLYSYQFRNNLDILLSIMEEKRELYEKASNDIQKIIELIDQELTSG